MDIHVQQIATDVEPLEMSDFMYTVGSGSITEGVDELILGLKAGEELKLNGSVGGGVVATYDHAAEAGQRARATRTHRRVGRGEHRVDERRGDARRDPRLRCVAARSSKRRCPSATRCCSRSVNS